MANGLQHTISPGRIGKRLLGVSVAAMLGSAALVLVPSTASAFNIQGLIGSALGGHYGGGRYHHSRSASHHSRHHSYSKRDHEDSTESSDKEKDATEVDATSDGGGKSDGKVSSHRAPSGPVGGTQQASESDARAGQVASDEPTFAPSR
jgi:hypothetical protein